MNAGVALCRAYLQLNGYFTQAELPVIQAAGEGSYREVADLDPLGVRFPRAATVVPGVLLDAEPLRLDVDPRLELPETEIDVIIAEVKEGAPRMNEAMRSGAVLRAALHRVGCAPPEAMGRVVGDLQHGGVSHLRSRESGIPCRVRLMAFGDGPSSRRRTYTVFSMRHVKEFVASYLDHHHDVLQPADLSDPVLGLLHLLRKLS